MNRNRTEFGTIKQYGVMVVRRVTSIKTFRLFEFYESEWVSVSFTMHYAEFLRNFGYNETAVHWINSRQSRQE